MRIVGWFFPLFLEGCLVMTPSPAMKVLELASLSVNHASALVASGPDNPVVMPYERQDGVCIELDQTAAVSDFVPALQAELAKNGINSRVYDAVLPPYCSYAIHYVLQLEWDRRLFQSEYQPYLSSARIELRQQGRILAASSYRLGMLGLDKWSSTRDKLAASVKLIAASIGDVSSRGRSRGRPEAVPPQQGLL
jgi:hypothetical protein